MADLDRESSDKAGLPLIDAVAAAGSALNLDPEIGVQLRAAYEDAWAMGGSEAVLWREGLSKLMVECGEACKAGDVVKARELDTKWRALVARRAASGGPAEGASDAGPAR